MDYIAFYGTLKDYTGPDLEYSHDDVVDGRFYDLGGFPVLLVHPYHTADDWIKDRIKESEWSTQEIPVRVFYIRDQECLERFDRYEGVPHLYTRIQYKNFWLYTMSPDQFHEVEPVALPIPRGVWTNDE